MHHFEKDVIKARGEKFKIGIEKHFGFETKSGTTDNHPCRPSPHQYPRLHIFLGSIKGYEDPTKFIRSGVLAPTRQDRISNALVYLDNNYKFPAGIYLIQNMIYCILIY